MGSESTSLRNLTFLENSGMLSEYRLSQPSSSQDAKGESVVLKRSVGEQCFYTFTLFQRPNIAVVNEHLFNSLSMLES